MGKSAGEILDEVNRLTGRRWRLINRFSSGYQSGAYRIEDEDGPAVLKWWDRPSWAPRVLAAQHLVAHARSCGYPTPEWLAAGVTSNGWPFEVQEFIAGETGGPLLETRASALVELVELQRSISFDEAIDWSHYVVARAAGRDGALERLKRCGGATAEAAMRASALARQYEDQPLVAHEMVHGDLSHENVVWDGDRISGVVDIEAVGRGFAGFDLLTPVRASYLWGQEAGAAVLLETALKWYGAGAVARGVAVQVADILDFGRDQWPSEDLEGAARSCLEWLADVGNALAT